MGDSVLREVLTTIRAKLPSENMDIKPTKRIYGTDMEKPNNTDEYLEDMAKRIKIKERLRAARERRKAQLERLDRELDQQVEQGKTSESEIKLPLTGKVSMQSLVNEYLRRRGKSVKLVENEPHSSNEMSPVTRSKDRDIPSPMISTSTPTSSGKMVVTAQIEPRPAEKAAFPSAENFKCDDSSGETFTNAEPESHNQNTMSPNKNSRFDDTMNESPTESGSMAVLPTHVDQLQSLSPIENNNSLTENCSGPTNNESDKKMRYPHTVGDKKVRKKWKKPLAFAIAATRLKQKIREEHEKQIEFLETIRILRGISEKDFYKDMEGSSSEEDEEEEEEEEVEEEEEEEDEAGIEDKNETEEVPEEDSDNESVISDIPSVLDSGEKVMEIKVREVKVRKKKPRTIKTHGCRIDTRWPTGHPHHTRPEVIKRVSYPKPKKSIPSPESPKFPKFPTKEMLDYAIWREQLLQIAYLKEFDRFKGKSLREFSIPLPNIHTDRKENDKKRKVSDDSSLTPLDSERETQSINFTKPFFKSKNVHMRSSSVGYLFLNSPHITIKHQSNSKKTDSQRRNESKDSKSDGSHRSPANSIRDLECSFIRTGVENQDEKYGNNDDNKSFGGKGETETSENHPENFDMLNTKHTEKSQSSDSAINEPSNHSDLENESEVDDQGTERRSYGSHRTPRNISVDDYTALVYTPNSLLHNDTGDVKNRFRSDKSKKSKKYVTDKKRHKKRKPINSIATKRPAGSMPDRKLSKNLVTAGNKN